MLGQASQIGPDFAPGFGRHRQNSDNVASHHRPNSVLFGQNRIRPRSANRPHRAQIGPNRSNTTRWHRHMRRVPTPTAAWVGPSSPVRFRSTSRARLAPPSERPGMLRGSIDFWNSGPTWWRPKLAHLAPILELVKIKVRNKHQPNLAGRRATSTSKEQRRPPCKPLKASGPHRHGRV